MSRIATQVHVCRAPDLGTTRAVLRCTGCRRRRRHTLYDSGWYGTRRVCNHCGFTVDDGQRVRLTPNQRKATALEARRDWRTAITHADCS